MFSRLAISVAPSPSALSFSTGLDQSTASDPVDACRLGFGDTLRLTLAPQVGFEFREHAEHVEKALAGRRAGVDRLLGGLQRRAGGPYGAHDIPKVTAHAWCARDSRCRCGPWHDALVVSSAAKDWRVSSRSLRAQVVVRDITDSDTVRRR
jgi:hypothetical protein